MSVFQRGELYVLERKFRDKDGNVLTPTLVTMSITFPCSNSVNVSGIMTNNSGTWSKGWNIPSTATYGEYTVITVATVDTGTYKYVNSFYILPWNIIQQVRSISGIKQSNDIEDEDLAIICWNAYLEAKEKVFKEVIHEKLKTDSSHCIDGSNKKFYAQNQHIVSDHIICGESSIYGYYKDNDSNIYDLTISITNADTGELSIADENGYALSNISACDIYYNYRVKSHKYSEQLFKKAVAYLASHEVIIRFNELDKATLGDLNSNAPIILANPNRMLKQYKRTMKSIKKLLIGGI